MKKVTVFVAACVIAATAFICKAQDNKPAVPAYSVIEKPQIDLSAFPIDEEGYYIIFNGTDLTGWRTYGKDEATSRWSVDDGAIYFNSSKEGENQKLKGGNLLFAHKFKNFILECEWKVAKGANSGILYLAQEVSTVKEDGTTKMAPIWYSAPEYQILDNENHPDAKLGVDGNRQSASLYDMIPANPQNAKPYGEWNTAKITVNNGTVVHSQNGEDVLEYHLWTPEWTEMLRNSKFREEKLPLAFLLLNNCGGDAHEGYIGFQDHGNDVWYRKIRIKILD